MIDLDASIYEQRHCQNAEGCCKTASDLARYRILLDRIRPSVLVELGTYSGKSAVWFADNGAGHVISVDVSHGPLDPATRSEGDGRVTWILGNTSEARTVKVVAGLVAMFQAKGGHTMVVVDSDHSAAHVAAEMAAYGPMVTAGSYMVVEDGITRWLPEQLKPLGPYTGTPLDAIEAWIAARPAEWEIDTDIEDRYPTTQFPAGFLRRIGQ